MPIKNSLMSPNLNCWGFYLIELKKENEELKDRMNNLESISN